MFLNPTSDVAKYQCYTVGFWQGMHGVTSSLTHKQCGFMNQKPVTNVQIGQFLQRHHAPQPIINFVTNQPVNSAFHVLPHEYPYLTIFIFSLALIVPTTLFQLAFAIWMAVLFAIMYLVIKRFRSRGAALAFALFMVTGASVTGLARFDLIPAAATLFAVVCAAQKRWNWAYIFLALATLLKFYPGVLLVPFLLAQQMEIGKQPKWYAWQRWRALVIFVVLCVIGLGSSLLLSVEGTVGQFTFFGQRPIQAESFGASLMWIATSITHVPMAYAKTFGSLNIVNHASLMSKVSLLEDVLLVAGLLYTWWLQWRGKLNLAAACLLTLLVIIVTGKVFSPQYLIWVAPLVAYVGGPHKRWVISWSIIGLLTTIIYPIIYNQAPLVRVPYVPAFFPLAALRNFILLGFVLALFVYSTRQQQQPAPVEASPVETPLPGSMVAQEVNR
jgi:hypothetical protein